MRVRYCRDHRCRNNDAGGQAEVGVVLPALDWSEAGVYGYDGVELDVALHILPGVCRL